MTALRKWKVILAWTCAAFGTLEVMAQPGSGIQAAWVDSVLLQVRKDQTLDARTKSELADSAFQVSAHMRDTCRQVRARILQATELDNLGMSDSALIQLYWANAQYRAQCDTALLMDLFVNLTSVYLSLGELDRIDSIGRIALDLWSPAWKPRDSRFAILTNIAIAEASRGEFDRAAKIFRQLIQESGADDNVKYNQQALINLGTIKGIIEELDSAFYFLDAAASLAQQYADINNLMPLLINLANVEMERKRYRQSLALLDSAYALAEARENLETIANVQHVRAYLFASMHNYEEAYNYLREYQDIREEHLDAERIKAVTEMMERYESERKARQIQQLRLEKLDATLENERITNARNRLLFAGGFILLAAIGLWSRLRYMRKSRAAIQREKEVADDLLLNILPASIAEELKRKGHAHARDYHRATILFSDFKGFTQISEQLSPADLVAEINVCFKAFDEIMTRYGIEKIKTIGDAYMGAGGLPDINSATVVDVLFAAFDMQAFVRQRKAQRATEGMPAFEMRIGIHSGPVVAGIVGVKKFQYDLWGDTVNIASRMESNGEAGHVNISEETYKLVKDDERMLFTPRGRIHAKGKGDLAMYFVELADGEGDFG